MQSIQKKELPHKKLEALGVAVVYLFGSRAEGTAGASSDIDIGIVFADPKAAAENTNELYNTLYDIFTNTFDMSGFRTIDIVFLERAPLELRYDAVANGIILFEQSADFRLGFEERVMALYRDFKPLLKQFDEAVLERI